MKAAPLNIKDPETYRAARELADLTGETLTATVRTALKERLERLRRVDDSAERIARMREIAEHCSSLPVLDSRSADEILGYDEIGLPT